MPVYPKCVAEMIRRPEYTRSDGGNDAEGSEVKLDCGCFVTIGISVSGDPQMISSIDYGSNGCGYMIASAEMLCSRLDGAYLVDLHGIDGAGFASLLEELDPRERLAREQCFEAVDSAVRHALADHRRSRIEESSGEKVLACTCFGVTEEQVTEFIAEHSPESPADIADQIRAGSGCGSCRLLLQEMLDTASRRSFGW